MITKSAFEFTCLNFLPYQLKFHVMTQWISSYLLETFHFKICKGFIKEVFHANILRKNSLTKIRVTLVTHNGIVSITFVTSPSWPAIGLLESQKGESERRPRSVPLCKYLHLPVDVRWDCWDPGYPYRSLPSVWLTWGIWKKVPELE